MQRVKQFLQRLFKIEPAYDHTVIIKESSTHEQNATRNRLWYRGDPAELEQFFVSTSHTKVEQARFWASRPSKGRNVRKIHSGIPGIMVDMLADIAVTDMLEIKFTNDEVSMEGYASWKDIAKATRFEHILAKAVQDTLIVGDGAFKISYDSSVSKLPIIEFVSGERVSYVWSRGYLQEIQYFSRYHYKQRNYILVERRGSNSGKGYITYELYNEEGNKVKLSDVPELADLNPVEYEGDFILGLPMMIYESPKFAGRGRSIFDLKTDSFDALDETISQWQDAIRMGRIKRYIPEDMIPFDIETGEPQSMNPFDNEFVALRTSRGEDASSTIMTDVPQVQYEGYVTTYVNNLDMALQGIISPSTLGIDLKKTDNATAQREKEKTTLYTRNKIVSVLAEIIPTLIDLTYKSYSLYLELPFVEIEAKVEFGEYANPSFEAQVESIGKASSTGIMSIRSQVETLWGDTRDEDWIEEEILRIRQERGMVDMEEPSMRPHGFVEDDLLDDDRDWLDRRADNVPDSDGARDVRINEQDTQTPRIPRKTRGNAVDTVASSTSEESS